VGLDAVARQGPCPSDFVSVIMLRIHISIAVLCTILQLALAARALSRSGTESPVITPSNRGDATQQFSLVASQALTNLSTQMSQFQRMVSTRSSQLQAELQGEETTNDEIEEANTRIQAANMKLEADNHALERRARALANTNKKLGSSLHSLEGQLQIARSMAMAVDSFASKDTSKEADDSVGIDTALIAISTETETMTERTRFLVQQEKLSVGNLQHSFDSAVANVKQLNKQLVEAQKQLNTTHVQLVARRGRLMKLLAKLQATHNRMQRRSQKLGSFLRQLAGIAAHSKGVSQEAAQPKPQTATDEQAAAQQPPKLAESPQQQQQQHQHQQQPAKPRPTPQLRSTSVALQVGHKGKKKKKTQAESENDDLMFDSVLNQLHR